MIPIAKKQARYDSRVFIVALPLFCFLFCVEVFAHPLGGVIQNTHVFRPGDSIFVDYQTHIGPVSLMLLKTDTDGDGRLSEDEKKALLKELEAKLLPNIVVTLDGRPMELRHNSEGLSLVNPDSYLAGINSRLLYEIDLKGISAGRHVLHISDSNFLSGELDSLSYFMTVLGETERSRLLDEGRMLEIVFVSGQKGTQEKETSLAVPQGIDHPNQTEANSLTKFLREKDVGAGKFIVGLIVAVFLGAAHALSPGHGKAMVAAYLVGSKGRILDAVYLGGVVTLTHVMSVIVLGLITVFLSNYIVPHKLFPWIGVFSGALIFLVGYFMLASRALGKSGQEHSHRKSALVRDSRHSHVSGSSVTRRSLFSLGVAGGMVPCPTALVVLLVSIAMQCPGLGLLLILFFSIGLAGVLVIIGVLIVTASKLTEKFSEHKRWVQHVPVFSAGVIMIVGILAAFSALLSAKIIVIS